MKDFIEGEDLLDRSNVVAFPVDPKLEAATRAYRTELERYDRADREGRRARFSTRIKTAYFAALFEGRFGRDVGDHSPI